MTMAHDDRRLRGRRSRNWQDWVNLLLAICLFVSPWVLNFGAESGGGAVPGGGAAAGGNPAGNAAWNAWIFGALVGIVAIWALSRIAPWQEWVNLIFGIWIFIAPWVLGFNGLGTASWDHWIIGFLVFIFALWDLSAIRMLGGGTESVDMAHAGDRPLDPPPADRPIDRRP